MPDAKHLDEQFRQRFLARDAAGLAALYAPDAVLYDVGPEFEFRGRAAIEAHFREVLAALVPHTFELETEVAEHGDFAYVHGIGVIAARGADGQDLPTVKMRLMDVRRRAPDGTWQVVVDHLSAQPG